MRRPRSVRLSKSKRKAYSILIAVFSLAAVEFAFRKATPTTTHCVSCHRTAFGRNKHTNGPPWQLRIARMMSENPGYSGERLQIEDITIEIHRQSNMPSEIAIEKITDASLLSQQPIT